MEKDNRNAYSEVIEILKFLDDEKKLEALPIEMLEVLKSKANPEYKPQISKDIPLEEQNLQPETLSILAWIATKYWNEELKEEVLDMANDTQKEEIQNSQENIENNVEAEQETKMDESEENNLEAIVQEEKIDNEKNNLPILHKDLKWYEKIKEKILEFFSKIFGKKKKEGNTI